MLHLLRHLKPFPPPCVVIPISGVHRGIVDAVDFAQATSKNVSVVDIILPYLCTSENRIYA